MQLYESCGKMHGIINDLGPVMFSKGPFYSVRRTVNVLSEHVLLLSTTWEVDEEYPSKDLLNF